ncbi:MAG: hypothetical protein RBR67_01950 [Desulfobacterium sp.]|jgi:hypothetical protein|nr:hypothetical protein [Desulfobacterium sp.]
MKKLKEKTPVTQINQVRRNQVKATLTLTILVLIFWFVVAGCSDGGSTLEQEVKTYPETFSFMDVGINTSYSRPLRQQLGNLLGGDAIQNNNTIELEINRENFLQDYFPAFYSINQALNTPPRERVEHKSIKLMYRYAQKKGLAFDYVEFLFSEYTLSPLLIRVYFKFDNLGIDQTLTEKYGKPVSLDWDKDQPHSTSLVWEKNGDLMILSTIPDQLGRPNYQINIYFKDRLEDFIKTEFDLKQREEEQKPVEKKVF